MVSAPIRDRGNCGWRVREIERGDFEPYTNTQEREEEGENKVR